MLKRTSNRGLAIDILNTARSIIFDSSSNKDVNIKNLALLVSFKTKRGA